MKLAFNLNKMPVTKQAIKKVRQDRRKAQGNMRVRRTLKKTVSDFRKKPTTAALSIVYKALDRAAKTNVIHKNKAGRLKSRLSKMLRGASKLVSASSSKTKSSKKKS